MKSSFRALAAALGFGAVSLAAQAAVYGSGSSGGLSWEQVRFYAPSGVASATYPGGQPTYYGSGTDYCSGSDRCGEPLTFDTLIGGALTTTAADSGSGNGIVYQDLSPGYAGLGVISRSNSGGLSGSDEINRGETLTLSFANKVKVVGFHFYDKDHGTGDLGRYDDYGLSIDGGPTVSRSLDDPFPWFGAGSTLIGNSFTFSYVNEDYYLGAIKIAAMPVPEPQSLALLALGLAALGFTRRRQAR
jgi:hypothetical protein